MTTDKVRSALVSWLDDAKPDSSITVTDAQTFDEAALPRVSVRVTSSEKVANVLPGCYRMTLLVEFRAHSGDDETRSTVEGWAEDLEVLFNDPELAKTVLTLMGDGIRIDWWTANGGVPSWDGEHYVAEWEVECVAGRIG